MNNYNSVEAYNLYFPLNKLDNPLKHEHSSMVHVCSSSTFWTIEQTLQHECLKSQLTHTPLSTQQVKFR